MKKLSRVVLLALLASSCAHKLTFKDTEAWNEAPKSSVGLQLKSAKLKRRKIEVTYLVKNAYENMIVIPEGSMGLTAGEEIGITSGNLRYELRPGQVVQQRLTFEFDEKPIGPFKLQLGGIYKGEEYTSDVKTFGAAWGNRTLGATTDGYKKKSAVENERLPSVQIEFVTE